LISGAISRRKMTQEEVFVESDESYYSKSLTASNKVLVTPELIKPIQEKLVNPDTPIAERYRCVFTLSNLGGPLATKALASAFQDKSTLLKHEIAYVIGQLQDKTSIPVLRDVLADPNQDPVVRHEAGEALGAIATPECLEIVREYLNDPAPEVRETCELAVSRIEWLQSQSEEKSGPCENFHTVDPAPPMEGSAVELGDILADESRTLFDRYRALFGLRDLQSDEGVKQLMRGFQSTSALLRHEVAYVLGQLQVSSSFDGLKEVLTNMEEHPMVRHEAAEAIGALPIMEVNDVLSVYLDDPEPLVKESCIVALDVVEYMNSDELEYANAHL
jgi:deoxyhypusine monooxygenase